MLVAVWLDGNSIAHICKVTPHLAQLVLTWRHSLMYCYGMQRARSTQPFEFVGWVMSTVYIGTLNHCKDWIFMFLGDVITRIRYVKAVFNELVFSYIFMIYSLDCYVGGNTFFSTYYSE